MEEKGDLRRPSNAYWYLGVFVFLAHFFHRGNVPCELHGWSNSIPPSFRVFPFFPLHVSFLSLHVLSFYLLCGFKTRSASPSVALLEQSVQWIRRKKKKKSFIKMDPTHFEIKMNFWWIPPFSGLIPITRQCCCLLLYLNLHWFNNNLFIAVINIGIFAALLKCFCFGEPACTGYGGAERAGSADVVPADPQVTGCGGGGRGCPALGAGEGTCRSGTESRGNPWWGRLKIIGVHLVLLEPQVVLYW